MRFDAHGLPEGVLDETVRTANEAVILEFFASLWARLGATVARHDFVPDPWFIQKEPRADRVFLELFAQRPHRDAQIFDVGHVRWTPDSPK